MPSTTDLETVNVVNTNNGAKSIEILNHHQLQQQQLEDDTVIKSLPNSPSASSTSTESSTSSSTSSSRNSNETASNSIMPLPNDELDILIKMERANK
jgi:hypothetical protein